MGQSTEELTSQIEDTRRRMAGDLDTLQDRVSPSAIVERRKQAVRGRFSSVRDSVMGKAQSAKDSVSGSVNSVGGSISGSVGGSDSGGAGALSRNAGAVADTASERFEGAPLAAGLVAFGAGVVLASLLPASRVEAEAAHRVVETAKEQGQPLVEDVRAAGQQVVDGLKESATDAASQVKDTAQQSAQSVKQEGQSSVESVRDQASS